MEHLRNRHCPCRRLRRRLLRRFGRRLRVSHAGDITLPTLSNHGVTWENPWTAISCAILGASRVPDRAAYGIPPAHLDVAQPADPPGRPGPPHHADQHLADQLLEHG